MRKRFCVTSNGVLSHDIQKLQDLLEDICSGQVVTQQSPKNMSKATLQQVWSVSMQSNA